MKYFFCLIVVATAVTLMGICGCRQQPADPPKAQMIGNPEKGPPKLPEPFTSSIGMKFVWIPPGTFTMGSPKEEKGRRDDYEAQHKVTLTKGFYMGVYPVVEGEWRAVLGANAGGSSRGGKDYPITIVEWDECQDFIKKLSEKDRKPYRLPTEAEWEYACRAGTTTPYYFGETLTNEQANYGKSREGTSVVVQWADIPLTHGGFTTCTATSGNCVKIGLQCIRKTT